MGAIAADRLMGEIGEGGGNFEEADMMHLIAAAAGVSSWLYEPVQKEWLTRRRALIGGSQP